MTALERVESVISWLTPTHLKQDVHLRKRARMFLFSHVFGPFLGLPIPAAMFLVDPNPFPHVPILAASIAGFWLFLPLIKLFPRQYTLLAQVSILNLNFAVLWGSYFYGGTSSAFLMWYMLMPMLALFYLGASMKMRIAVFAQILVGLGVFMASYVISGQPFPSNIPLESMVYAGVLSAFCATTYAFFMASYYSSVVDSQSELMQEITRHETTLEELTLAKGATDKAHRALKRAKGLVDARNTQLETTKASLEHSVLHDALTGLPNRRYLDETLAEHERTAALQGRDIAVLHIDLDRFKQINDTLGHSTGDAMLVHVAKLLKTIVGADDFVARVGGDEFIVVSVLMDRNDVDLADLAQHIIEQIRQPVPYQGNLCRFGASVGIAVESGEDIDAKRLLVNSDIALYRAKDRGKNRCEFFSEELQLQIVNSKSIADGILRGIEQNEFFAVYQPQFDARSLDIVGVEALVRWKHPTQGVLAPAAFLQIAEELNAVAIIDRLILEQSLAHFDRWEKQGLRIPKVSVNVSARRLNDRELIDSLRELNIKPGTVSFELVESIFLDETDEIVAWNIEQIKGLDIDIEIDDFGTGHASIVSLLKLNPKRLKIDRQFVMSVTEAPETQRLVSSIIEMGKSLGIEVVAEGVETMEQTKILDQLGCDVLQGYALAKPMTVEALEAFAKGRLARKAS